MAARSFLLAPVALLATMVMATADEFRGVVRQVSPDKKELTIEGRGRAARGIVMHVDVSKDTRVRLGHDPGQPSDLEPGEHIRVVYQLRNGRRVAVAITVHGLKKPAPAAPRAPADANTVTGKLVRVAVTDREIVVLGPGPKGPETETTLAVPEKAQITRDHKPIKLDDLKEEQQVVVKTQKQGGKLVASSIQVGENAKPAMRRNDRIERLRQLLKLADEALQRLEQERNPNR